MEKNKSLLDDEKFQKKLAKLSPTDRAKIKQDILEGEKERRKEQRAKERLMRMPKEERLKKICRNFFDAHYRSGHSAGILIGQGRLKPFTEARIRKGIQQGAWHLTMNLKKAGVLPLEG